MEVEVQRAAQSQPPKPAGRNGSTALTTTARRYTQHVDYSFGESWYAGGTADPSVLRKYTTYLKDDEASTGRLNYAVFREHSARIGRFHMADPVQRKGNPQGLNRYAYVMNSPTHWTDPNGLYPCSAKIYVDPNTGKVDCLLAFEAPISGFGFGDVGGFVGAHETWQNQQFGYVSWIEEIPAPDLVAQLNPNSPLIPKPQPPATPPPGIVQVGPRSIDPRPLDPGRPGIEEKQHNWEIDVLGTMGVPERPPQGSGSLATTLTCSLQIESGSRCEYRCSSRESRGASPFSATIDQLRQACPAFGSITQCPGSIQVRGITGGDLQVTACSQ